MSDNENIKKRRVGDGSVEEDSASSELTAIKSLLQEVLNQNRIQTTTIQTMQRDMTRLSNKCDSMEASIQNNHTTNSTMTTRLGNSCDRIERKLDQHDTLLQDQNRAQAATNNVIRTHSRVHSNNHNVLRSAIGGLDVKLNNMETKQKYQEILLQNQKWEYSAPSPSQEEWESFADNDTNVDIDDAKEFLQEIKKVTEDMRWSQTNGCISLSPMSNFLYNRMFYPHWEEFANALEQYQYHIKCTDYITTDNNKPSLRLNGMELPDVVIDLLSRVLKSTHFHAFSIGDISNFNDHIINFALEYLKTNVDMQEFGINNNIMPMKDIERLSEIVKNHPSIKRLELPSVDIPHTQLITG